MELAWGAMADAVTVPTAANTTAARILKDELLFAN